MPFEMLQSQGQHLIVPNARNWVISSLGESNWNHWRGFSFGTSCMVYSLWHPCSSNHGRASSDSLVLYIPFIYNRFDELWENFWLIWLNAFPGFHGVYTVQLLIIITLWLSSILLLHVAFCKESNCLLMNSI